MISRMAAVATGALLVWLSLAGMASAQNTSNTFYKEQARQAEQRRATNARITNTYIQQQRYNATRPTAPRSYYKPTAPTNVYKPRTTYKPVTTYRPATTYKPPTPTYRPVSSASSYRYRR